MKRGRSYSKSGPIKKRARYRAAGNARSAGFLGMELKFYDTARAALALTAPTDASGAEADPTTLNCISAPAQGTSEKQRDGRKIVIKSVSIRGNVRTAAQANQTAADVASSVFVALVQDCQTNAAQLASENVFTNPSSAATLATAPFRNLEYIRRFKVLKTKRIVLPQPMMVYDGTNVEQGGQIIPFEFHKKVNIPVNFTSTTEGVSNVADNSLHVIAYTDATSLAPELNYNSRIRFMG